MGRFKFVKSNVKSEALKKIVKELGFGLFGVDDKGDEDDKGDGDDKGMEMIKVMEIMIIKTIIALIMNMV